jgi:hypothetical protein
MIKNKTEEQTMKQETMVNSIVNFVGSSTYEKINMVKNILDDNDFTAITNILKDHDKWDEFKQVEKDNWNGDESYEWLKAIVDGLEAILWPIYVTA